MKDAKTLQESTSFAQPRWLIGDLFAQKGGVRSDAQTLTLSNLKLF